MSLCNRHITFCTGRATYTITTEEVVMTHIITNLCLRDNGCMDVCPVECINPGTPVQQWPTYYIDPATCIDCGACIPECPFHAIFPEDEVPAAYQATGDEVINGVGFTGRYES